MLTKVKYDEIAEKCQQLLQTEIRREEVYVECNRLKRELAEAESQCENLCTEELRLSRDSASLMAQANIKAILFGTSVAVLLPSGRVVVADQIYELKD